MDFWNNEENITLCIKQGSDYCADSIKPSSFFYIGDIEVGQLLYGDCLCPSVFKFRGRIYDYMEAQQSGGEACMGRADFDFSAFWRNYVSFFRARFSS